MTKAIVIGDGPAGLSAALFLAKNGVETTVFGQDNTAMHYAELHNYLGIPVLPKKSRPFLSSLFKGKGATSYRQRTFIDVSRRSRVGRSGTREPPC